MDELFLYDRDNGLFKKILNKSKVIQGRYHVSKNGGADLNANNFDSYVTDQLGGIALPGQKYPLCVCLSPLSSLSYDKVSTMPEKFYFELYFVCNSGYTGQNKVKQPNQAINASTHHPWYDWKDMKEVAINFILALKKVVRKNNLQSHLSIDLDDVPVKRFTDYGNDKLSGVRVVLSVEMVNECDLADYEDEDLSTLTITPTTIHQHHKH